MYRALIRILHLPRRPWRGSTLLLGASLAGLLIAIAIAGVVGLAINQNVHNITERALEYDIEIEDEGDDLRAAILDLRHFHRDIAFSNAVSAQSLANLTRAYNELEEQIRDYAKIDIAPGENVISATEMQELADRYWSTFRPAIDVFATDPAAFDRAEVESFGILQEMEDAAQVVDRLGEELAEDSLANVDAETLKARNILFALLGGLVLTGVGLTWATVHVVAHVRQLYEGQQAVAAQLAGALKANTNFIADASHELRTPLTVLRGNAEAGIAIRRDCEHAEILEEIVDESARMTRLIDNLLFLARSDASSVPLQLETTDAQDWLHDLAERAEILARKHGATLTTTLSGVGTLAIDIERIGQAVMILVDNAAKYSSPGGRISLLSSSWKNELTIEVADNGVGISADALPHVFERFYRAGGRQDGEGSGAGLGLPIAKSIVEAHGGRIEVQSIVGEGTRMRMHLPLVQERFQVVPGARVPHLTNVAG